MKQCIIIAAAMILVVILNIWQLNYLKTTSRYMLTDINEIDNSVKRDDFKSALNGVEELERTWNSIESGWDVFGEHNDIEQISEHITSMKVYSKYEDKEELVNEYKLLEQLINHIIDSEKLEFSNVL